MARFGGQGLVVTLMQYAVVQHTLYYSYLVAMH
jgi:hypothetical protein